MIAAFGACSVSTTVISASLAMNAATSTRKVMVTADRRVVSTDNELEKIWGDPQKPRVDHVFGHPFVALVHCGCYDGPDLCLSLVFLDSLRNKGSEVLVHRVDGHSAWISTKHVICRYKDVRYGSMRDFQRYLIMVVMNWDGERSLSWGNEDNPFPDSYVNSSNSERILAHWSRMILCRDAVNVIVDEYLTREAAKYR